MHGAQGKLRYSPELRERARALRHSATEAEQALWELVRNRRCGGWRFVRQAPVTHYILDFFCPKARLAIEVDGSIHDVAAVRLSDADRQQLLEEHHICFLRLTNSEVLRTAPEELSARIEGAAAMAASKVPPHPHPARRQ